MGLSAVQDAGEGVEQQLILGNAVKRELSETIRGARPVGQVF